MTRRLIVPHALEDFLRHLSPVLKKKIRQAMEEIADDPHVGKPLTAQLEGLWSHRVGRTRIIYRVDETAITLIDLGPRRTIYQKVALELGRAAGADPRSTRSAEGP
jgi:mRNA-degrading endonuclease RelE of RelBE toxin-antitoxin system